MRPISHIAPSAHCFTAAQLAVALRISKRNTLIALAEIQPAGTAFVQGNETSVWSFDLLPERFRETIILNARQNGLSIADYLAALIKPWQASVAMSEISEDCFADTKKLRDALLPALEREGKTMFEKAELVRLGLADYQRAFGYPVSEHHWRRLMHRTWLRAAGTNDFTRIELYLPKKPARKTVSTPGSFKDDSILPDFIAMIVDPANPTDSDIAALFGNIFEACGAKDLTKREWKQLRRVIAKQLHKLMPSLGASERALRVNLDRKYQRWLSADGNTSALLDGRIQKRGISTAKPFPQGDIDRIMAAAALDWGGKVAPALRRFVEMGERSGLSAETLEVITRHRKSKSDFNRRLLNKVVPDVRMVIPFFLGKKAVDDATAHVERDYSKLSSMQVVNADDATMNLYFYVPDGNGWWNLTRGQVLIFIDVRSLKIIAWSLQPERNYNSFIIRTLMNRVCTECGIPKVWHLEKGIWKKSHLVKGTAPAGWNVAADDTELKTGWEKLGVRFLHSIRARSKPVERVIGMLQDRMHGVRGYCGRDERHDLPANTRRAMDDVKYRRVSHPGQLFLSFEQWHEELAGIIANYNASSQDGRILAGLSPDEAFEKYWPHSDPPSIPDANWRQLTTHYIRPVRVTENGISFRLNGKSFTYRNARTGQDRGKMVLAWFDPETPDLLIVTDMDKLNPYLVERAYGVDYLAAPGDADFDDELAKAASHSGYPRARFNVIKAKFAPTYRTNLVDIQTAETGQAINRLKEEKLTEQKEAVIQKRKTRKSFSRLGLPEPKNARPELAEDAKRLAEILEDDSSEVESKSLQEKDGKFTYHLKVTGNDKTKYVDYLLKRLTEFRKGGASFGQSFHSAVTVQATQKIAAGQLKCNVHDESRFDEVCAYLKEKIDATILGKRNAAKGVTSYHEFQNETQQTHS